MLYTYLYTYTYMCMLFKEKETKVGFNSALKSSPRGAPGRRGGLEAET